MDRLYARFVSAGQEAGSQDGDASTEDETKGEAWEDTMAGAAAAPLPDTPARSVLRAPGSARRNEGLRLNWEGPFALPGLTPPRPRAAEEQDQDVGEDATMESVSGRSVMSGPSLLPNTKHDRLWMAPPMMKAPTLNEMTADACRTFAEKYTSYMHHLSSLETTHSRPYVASVSQCIDHRIKVLIAHYHVNKDLEKMTEQDYIDFIAKALQEDKGDYRAVDQAMKKLRLDTRIRDAPSRISKLVTDMHEILHKSCHEMHMMQHEPRKLVGYLTEALEPAAFKAKIKERMALQENKHLRDSTAKFARWLTEAMESFVVWEDSMVEESKSHSRGAAQTTGGAKKGRRATSSAGTSGATTDGSSGTSAGAATGRAPTAGASEKTRVPCLQCGSTAHLVMSCPDLKGRDDEKKRLLADGGLVAELEKLGEFLEGATLQEPQWLEPLGERKIKVTRRIRIRGISLTTSAGPLVLPPVVCYIDENSTRMTLILGRPLMRQLGYSTDGLLREAVRKLAGQASATQRMEEDETNSAAAPVAGREGEDEEPDRESLSPLHVNQLRLDEDATTDYDDRMALPDPTPESMHDVVRVLNDRHAEAVLAGLPEDAAAELRRLLDVYVGVFRLAMGCDPPLSIEPLRVKFKKDAKPVRCGVRRMNPVYMAYIERHIHELLAGGYLRRNPHSRWASPPRVVPKSTPGELRMTVDVRGVNSQTIPLLWPMPHPELVSLYVILAGAEHFLNLDADKMFWQLPLHWDSQEQYSIMTHLGIFSPLRVLMGSTDAPAFAQQASETVFNEQLLKEVLVWLDDVLGFAKTPMELMGVLERALQACVMYGLKLNPRKCVFYAREIKWCGRIISATGITHCPERISGLVGLDAPSTAADLQQFICAVNWMRSSIPNYNKVVAPLAALLEEVARAAKSRKKQVLKKVQLLNGTWKGEHQDAYNAVKKALTTITPLAYPRPDSIVCVFTDASLDHWGAAVTQVKPGAGAVVENIVDQEHEPLAFLSGSFSGASSRWPIVEKEAFAIVETCKRLEYLLLRDRGFRIYTDHRNLIYIFDPYATEPSMPRFQADKLQRWAITMMMFRYEIYHISGDDNVWGDLLSRWGSSDTTQRQVRVNALAVVDQVSPLQVPDFVWPSMEEVLGVQREELRARAAKDTLPDVVWSEEDQVYRTPTGKVWIPSTAVDMQQRLCVVAHAGAAGHRGQAVTAQVVSDKFEWETLKEDVRTFVRGCLHCLSVKGDKVPRPYGATLHATKPNEVLHFDFLSMPVGDDVSKYVLVLKDDMSGFVELIECASADADVVYTALLDWFKRFGVVSQWVSDQGSHFLNKVIEDLQKVLGSQHHFVTAYCPWANGTVEVVNRLLLRVLKALLSEHKLPPSEWPKLLPVVQSTLNSMPADRLGGVAPVTAFTQLPATTPLSVLFHPTRKENVTIEWVTSEQKRHLRETAAALEQMHRALSTEAETRRRAARDRHGKKQGVAMPRFQEGDFVLVGQVVTRANKLALRWRGPRRIVRVIHDYTYEVQNLCPPHEISVHHASRLQWYAEASREVTTDLLDHVRYGEGGHLVEKFLETRNGPDTHQLEVKVQWMGLDPLEASWEIAAELAKDVPVILTRFANTLDDTPHRQQLLGLLGAVGKAAKPKSRTKAATKANKGAKVRAARTNKQRPRKTGTAAKKGGGK